MLLSVKVRTTYIKISKGLKANLGGHPDPEIRGGAVSNLFFSPSGLF